MVLAQKADGIYLLWELTLAELSSDFKDFQKRKNKAAVGFEPTYNGFANRPLRPLGYAAKAELIYWYSAVFATKISCRAVLKRLSAIHELLSPL
jgi:hypothetical protein